MNAAPSNTTIYGWKAEPYVRGTSSILTSCLITLTLCVWTAVHLNIPKYQRTAEATRRKVLWLVTALLAPELVALVALSQWREARKLGHHVHEVYSQKSGRGWVHSFVTLLAKVQPKWGIEVISGTMEESDSLRSKTASDQQPARHQWTTTHSFYALMGGFALDTRNVEPNVFQNDRRRMILSADGFRFLLDHEPNLLPDLSRAEIQDKSKANNLAKTIVCVQAMWFCIQCFTRWSIGLSTSLLELNTFAHCICALIIFMLWWNKPLDVDEPTLISASNNLELASLLALYSGTRQQRQRNPLKMSHALLEASRGHPAAIPREEGQVILGVGDSYQGFIFKGFCAEHPRTVVKTLVNTVPGKLLLDENDMRRWEFAEKATLKYYPSNTFLGKCHEKMLVDRVDDVPKMSTVSRGAMLATFAFAGFLYGGVHLIAWNNSFRSDAEAYIWKISAIILASSGPLAVPFIFAEALWGNIGGDSGTWRGIYAGAILILIPVCGIVYSACRVYLIVESFWNLTHLEESTFVVPNWSQYFPHIT
ncbi:uncharacterized protein K460DRAFT_416340 [Cucurbitaria berberidis CBS 394.84]|uniref:Uncharacterized protein n=1 Tax=Cucurbitaria berberidis CBS 394.84 TaxID=1168544 RepID=A0A9P4GGN3_9PLEO|nr:uncharacterized protein K460DRAFT_416340 [Cucurbitaria berberidis CBS 394.84]KAF1845007.1 hypothetical protein K460DRAFT_416340 [Cucurbitaria berberidis CBS 394.84]